MIAKPRVHQSEHRPGGRIWLEAQARWRAQVARKSFPVLRIEVPSAALRPGAGHQDAVTAAHLAVEELHPPDLARCSSQKHEGWVLLTEAYDDGGLSGGTLERPALQRLLDDVDAGKVDQIVVYKIDRLTRSLADFAKLVDRLDGAGASFVSVTQSFNTATSMGRLTLNVLLSFAQFEREVTAERIRDKIAASKRKGLWMGGLVPFGFDADGRTLKIREDEAAIVREIFALYLRLGSVRARS